MNRLVVSVPLLVVALASMPCLAGCVVEPEAGGPGVVGNVDDFRADLAPYGQWIDTAQYGPVWKPGDAPPDYTPYGTNGHWEYTDEGWVFESPTPYAPIVYHYGNWYQDPSYGWVWVPGTVWGPSWVDWRFGPSYVGWYPVGPSGVILQGSGWYFVHTGDFVRHYTAARVSSSVEVSAAFHATEPVPASVSRTGARVSVGPAPERVEAATGVHVTRKSYHSMRQSSTSHPARGRSVHAR